LSRPNGREPVALGVMQRAMHGAIGKNKHGADVLTADRAGPSQGS
jgi:hypothetical protein